MGLEDILGFFGISLMVFLIVAGIIFIICVVYWIRHVKAWVMDYAVDFLFSELDNLIAGLGAVGLDIGDWIAAIIIFAKERKVSGTVPALWCSWEAANFIPFSFIPLLGEIIEQICNFTPTVTLTRMIFGKDKKAYQELLLLEKNMKIASELDIKTADKESLEKIRKQFKKENYVDTIKDGKKTNKSITEKIELALKKIIEDLKERQQLLEEEQQRIAEEELSEEDRQPLINILASALEETDNLITQAKENIATAHYQEALDAAKKVQERISQAAEDYDALIDDLNQQTKP